MKFSGVQCVITTTIYILMISIFLASIAVANEESTKDVKINTTELSVEDTGRKIFKKKVICPIPIPTPSVPDLSGISALFQGIQDFLSEIGNVFVNIGFPPLPDITSLLNNTDQILSIKKLQLPAIFFLSIIVGAIAAGITVLIPSLKSWKPDNLFGSMMDGIADMMQQANYNVPAQYGAPELDAYPPSQGYQSPDAYSLTYSGTDHRGANNNNQDFSAPLSTSQSQDHSFFPSGQGQGQTGPVANGGGLGQINSGQTAYIDPSTNYGSPVKRYSNQPYPSLSSNYLRTAKSRK